jgi:hypothetical protein
MESRCFPRRSERPFGLGCRPITLPVSNDVPVPASAAEGLGCYANASSCELATAQHGSIHPVRDTVSFFSLPLRFVVPVIASDNPPNCAFRISPTRPATWTSQTSCECARGSWGASFQAATLRKE